VTIVGLEALYVLGLVFVLVRQFRTRRIRAARMLWSLVYVALGVLTPGLVDRDRLGPSVALGVAVVLVGAAVGFAYGRLILVWHDGEGQAWFRATWIAVPVFLGVFAARGTVLAIGSAASVHIGPGFLLFSFAAMLLARTAVLIHRARYDAGRWQATRAGRSGRPPAHDIDSSPSAPVDGAGSSVEQ
jgi:hypothetical protein